MSKNDTNMELASSPPIAIMTVVAGDDNHHLVGGGDFKFGQKNNEKERKTQEIRFARESNTNSPLFSSHRSPTLIFRGPMVQK